MAQKKRSASPRRKALPQKSAAAVPTTKASPRRHAATQAMQKMKGMTSHSAKTVSSEVPVTENRDAYETPSAAFLTDHLSARNNTVEAQVQRERDGRTLSSHMAGQKNYGQILKQAILEAEKESEEKRKNKMVDSSVPSSSSLKSSSAHIPFFHVPLETSMRNDKRTLKSEAPKAETETQQQYVPFFHVPNMFMGGKTQSPSEAPQTLQSESARTKTLSSRAPVDTHMKSVILADNKAVYELELPSHKIQLGSFTSSTATTDFLSRNQKYITDIQFINKELGASSAVLPSASAGLNRAWEEIQERFASAFYRGDVEELHRLRKTTRELHNLNDLDGPFRKYGSSLESWDQMIADARRNR